MVCCFFLIRSVATIVPPIMAAAAIAPIGYMSLSETTLGLVEGAGVGGSAVAFGLGVGVGFGEGLVVGALVGVG
jgi:hypothetical protein